MKVPVSWPEWLRVLFICFPLPLPQRRRHTDSAGCGHQRRGVTRSPAPPCPCPVPRAHKVTPGARPVASTFQTGSRAQDTCRRSAPFHRARLQSPCQHGATGPASSPRKGAACSHILPPDQTGAPFRARREEEALGRVTGRLRHRTWLTSPRRCRSSQAPATGTPPAPACW